ncbi:NAD(P)H-dependent oxidoreductase [Agromyces intestinalis]|uniref:NAD(P)H-dependent oxidoreductase n=1 Tax=Agromyces intestinalis TaxID=2592652 RepID=A0A5C1YHN9_9MICO|nr:NAD(P)H-dependent oxidoreductase [Agromyces intestinalis]QEO14609.1 NAD(P)H-dependent oxidoreductase [Agromyces intestinalis]
MPDLRVLALNCTLKPSPAASSTELISRQVLDLFEADGATTELVRVVDHDIKPGVEADMGDGDEWPSIRAKVMAADVLLFATPTWMGHPSSVAQRALERLDAELSETDDAGRPILAGKVAAVAVVGNEDGAHAIIADVQQALVDVGFSVASQASTYWNGEAMGKTDYKDLDATPDAVATTNATVARHSAHLARVLRDAPYPPPEN